MLIDTILFDLDSTLNSINEMEFSQNYFTLLHKHYFSEFDFPLFCDILTECTRTIMMSKNSRVLTVKKFMKEMSKHFKLKPKKILERFTNYYANEYSLLEEYVSPAPSAKELVKLAFDLNYNVIIATTPIFTEHAIKQRIDWSGVGDFDYLLVTHAENMHFSKPREEYYKEISKKTKVKPANCLMVGNEFLGDIVAPTKIGMYTFHCIQNNLNNHMFVSPELKRFSKIKPTYQGTLEDLMKLLKGSFSKG
jgi:FMN phosphatase YigB (HAD superfamily)